MSDEWPFLIGLLIGFAWACLFIWLEYNAPPDRPGDKSILSDEEGSNDE